jgi:hypothetical protein
MAEAISNMVLHTDHINAIATLPLRQRNEFLAAATPKLVQALATLTRILHSRGYEFPEAHTRRARRMVSKNTAARTKMGLVAGTPGTQSRGGGFWKRLAAVGIATGVIAGGVVAASRRGGVNPDYNLPAPTHRVSGPWDLDQVYPDY